jgi:hypothetical protein
LTLTGARRAWEGLQRSLDDRPRAWLRACATLAAAWLGVVVCPSAISKTSLDDFAPLYLAGRLVLDGSWSDIYPCPNPGVTLNAGFVEGSTLRPAYRALAQREGLVEKVRFIYPPPVALLSAPFGTVTYRAALTLWIYVLGACTLLVALGCARWFEVLLGRRTGASGGIVLLVTASPLAYRLIRVGNVTPIVSLGLLGAACALWRGNAGRSAVGFAAGGVFKGTSTILLPLVLLWPRRRWLVPGGVAAIASTLVLATVLAGGLSPFETFFREIAPTLRHGSALQNNQSVGGALTRLGRHASLPDAQAAIVRVLGCACVLAVYGLVFLHRRRVRRDAVAFSAAVTALLALAILFSPLGWEHYQFYLVGSWAWLIRESIDDRRWRVAAVLVIASGWFPLAVVAGGKLPLPEPLRHHMTLSTGLAAALGFARLACPRREPGAPDLPGSRLNAGA